jgi:hypothetical protein
MIIGAMKCGTTTLARILEDHPEVSFCMRKEPDFFSTNNDWKANIDTYNQLFEKNNKAKILAEASTSYTKYPEHNLEIWNDIYEYNPDMKLIYLIRNPVDRVISHYMHAFERGYINDKIEDAIVTYPPLINNSRYYTQIKPYIDTFGMSNILILEFSEFISNKEQTISRIAEFLNIDMSKFTDFENIHANTSVGQKNKMHHKLDFLNAPFSLKLRRFFKLLIPKKIRSSIWFFIVSNRSREFKKKPVLQNRHKNIIKNMLYLEVKEFDKSFDMDLSKLWFKN